jgi:hypothetical protein
MPIWTKYLLICVAAFHGYEQSLLFDSQLIINAQDRKISDFLVESVVNFVKNG